MSEQSPLMRTDCQYIEISSIPFIYMGKPCGGGVLCKALGWLEACSSDCSRYVPAREVPRYGYVAEGQAMRLPVMS